jgi:SAM-dependent methyltransferase
MSDNNNPATQFELTSRPKGPLRCVDGEICCDTAWEAAYRRFETPRQEIRKFTRRLQRMGANGWPRDARIVELFCGRGNGLVALERLGFTCLEGVDLSHTLLAEYLGPAKCYVADCRDLPFAGSSKDVVIVQGGLHHLPLLPDDLIRVLCEAQRVLCDDGLLVVVEPWRTFFLDVVHWACRRPVVRRLLPRVEALATMIAHERETYEDWLSRPREIMSHFEQRFIGRRISTSWGKLQFIGVRRHAADA